VAKVLLNADLKMDAKELWLERESHIVAKEAIDMLK
jgi:hypothetical protein